MLRPGPIETASVVWSWSTHCPSRSFWQYMSPKNGLVSIRAESTILGLTSVPQISLFSGRLNHESSTMCSKPRLSKQIWQPSNLDLKASFDTCNKTLAATRVFKLMAKPWMWELPDHIISLIFEVAQRPSSASSTVSHARSCAVEAVGSRPRRSPGLDESL